jgi:cysteine dioxygenase
MQPTHKPIELVPDIFRPEPVIASPGQEPIRTVIRVPASLQQLVERLAEYGRPLTWEELLPAIASLPLDALDPLAILERLRRRREWMIHWNEHFELRCLRWRRGEFSSVHHHRSSRCCVRVLLGVLTNLDFIAEEGKLRVVGRSDIRTGEILMKEGTQTHQVSNQQVEGDTVTLHIYSPPLTQKSGFLAKPRQRRGI